MGLIKGISMSFGLLGGSVFLFLLSQMTLESTNIIGQKSEKVSTEKSICFLLGEDKSGYDYFRLAKEYYINDESDKTDRVVTTCRSIEEIIQYLNENNSNEPWSTIEVVLHGNPYSGLSTNIQDGGLRATPKNLLKSTLINKLPSLQNGTVNQSTQINFWGCGIGKNPFINMALDTFFSLESGAKPKIYTSPYFVIFKPNKNGDSPRKLNASYWPYIYKRGYRPSESVIAQAMREQYPGEVIDWESAINEDANNESIINNAFHIPVSWTVIYNHKDDRPNVSTEKEKMQWINSQADLVEKIKELHIPQDKFQWTVNKIIHTKDDGSKVPAIKAIGMATILCVLEEAI